MYTPQQAHDDEDRRKQTTAHPTKTKQPTCARLRQAGGHTAAYVSHTAASAQTAASSRGATASIRAMPRNGAHSRPSAHRCHPPWPPWVPSAGRCTRVVIKGAIAHQPRQRGLVVGQPVCRPRVLGRRRPRLGVSARGAGLELGRAHADTPWGGLEPPTGRHAHPATPAATTTADRTASGAVRACLLRPQMVHHAGRDSRPSRRRPRVGRPTVGRGRPSGPPYWQRAGRSAAICPRCCWCVPLAADAAAAAAASGLLLKRQCPLGTTHAAAAGATAAAAAAHVAAATAHSRRSADPPRRDGGATTAVRAHSRTRGGPPTPAADAATKLVGPTPPSVHLGLGAKAAAGRKRAAGTATTAACRGAPQAPRRHGRSGGGHGGRGAPPPTPARTPPAGSRSSAPVTLSMAADCAARGDCMYCRCSRS